MIKFHFRSWTNDQDYSDVSKLQFEEHNLNHRYINIINSIFLIDDVLYTKPTKEFHIAYNKQKLWMNLTR